jgi:hypothetical protein
MIESRLGGLDVLVNNARISGRTSPVEPKGRVRKLILPIISIFEGLWTMANNREGLSHGSTRISLNAGRSATTLPPQGRDANPPR